MMVETVFNGKHHVIDMYNVYENVCEVTQDTTSLPNITKLLNLVGKIRFLIYSLLKAMFLVRLACSLLSRRVSGSLGSA